MRHFSPFLPDTLKRGFQVMRRRSAPRHGLFSQIIAQLDCEI